MNIRTFIAALVFAVISSTLATPPVTSQPKVDVERLVLVYAHLKNAEQMATGGVALSKDDLLAAGRAMSVGALSKECNAMADRIVATLSTSPSSRRPETFAYIKNAMLRLTLNREEDHAGHGGWAGQHRDKVSAAIRECAKQIKEALTKI